MRYLVALVVGAVLLMTTAVPAAAQRSWRWDECTFRNAIGGPHYSHTEIVKTIRCGSWHWGASASTGVRVMMCESGGGADAVNPSGAYGLFQFMAGTFNGTYDRWRALWRRWDVKRDWFNARSNVLLAMRKASSDGWSAWTCA